MTIKSESQSTMPTRGSEEPQFPPHRVAVREPTENYTFLANSTVLLYSLKYSPRWRLPVILWLPMLGLILTSESHVISSTRDNNRQIRNKTRTWFLSWQFPEGHCDCSYPLLHIGLGSCGFVFAKTQLIPGQTSQEANRGAPDPQFSDPAGSGSKPDLDILDPAGSGSGSSAPLEATELRPVWFLLGLLALSFMAISLVVISFVLQYNHQASSWLQRHSKKNLQTIFYLHNRAASYDDNINIRNTERQLLVELTFPFTYIWSDKLFRHRLAIIPRHHSVISDSLPSLSKIRSHIVLVYSYSGTLQCGLSSSFSFLDQCPQIMSSSLVVMF